MAEALENALSRAGIDAFRFHDLHHTFADHLAMQGVSRQAIVQCLGHETLQMVIRDSHLSPEHLQGAVGLGVAIMAMRHKSQMVTSATAHKS